MDLINGGEVRPLQKRGLTTETCRKFNYTVSKYRGKPVQVAEYRNKAGAVVAQHIRFPDKEFMWAGDSKQACLFGRHLWGGGGRKIIITEGEIDAMSVSQAQGNKWPVVSLPGGAQGGKKAIAHDLDWLETFEQVIILFDMDEPGRAAAQECAALITPGKAYIASIPLKDANEMLLARQEKELLSAIWQAAPYRPDGILNGKDLWERIKKPPVPGYQIQFPELQEKLMGIRKREIYLFTAGSGIGKSTLVNEIAYHLFMQHGLKIGVMALEESVERAAKRYMSIYLNTPLHISHGDITDEQLEEAFKTTVGNDRWLVYEHFGSQDIDTLIGKIRFMIVAENVDFVVLDHISIVVSGLDEIGESERKTIDKLMTRLRSLVEETGAGLLAIVHLKRPEKGKSYNEGRQVSLSDLRGSASLEQLSDVVAALERDQQGDNPNMAHIRLLKNRPIGICGDAGYAEYEQETGRMLPAKAPDAHDCPFDMENDSAERHQESDF